MTDDRGLSFGNKPFETTTTEFVSNRAYVIGINAYSNGIPVLRTAVADAETLGTLLAESHGYKVRALPRDGEPSLANLRQLLRETLPQEVGANDRVLIYFAGHGIALDGEDGPEGYLVPADANREDRTSFLPMTELNKALAELPCRHLLLILDCCFAGAFRWSSTRDLGALPNVIHRERYERYIQDPAWQVLTSAAHDQTALDVLSGSTIGERIETTEHSPFAAALFSALAGDADLIPRGKDGQPGGDGVITATELYLYLRECVETATKEQSTRQTPGLWPLKKHDKGEYILLTPGHQLNLPPAPELNEENNPYRGLQSFDEEHAQLFFGRSKFVTALAECVRVQSLTIVLGASGTGKSSVVKAGLLPWLRCRDADAWHIVPPLRPGKSPLAALAALTLPGESGDPDAIADRKKAAGSDAEALAHRVSNWAAGTSQPTRLLIVVDQFEELLTLCWATAEREQFLMQLDRALAACADRLRVVLTLRSDFEPQFAHSPLQEEWLAARIVVPVMTLDEYREAIEGPASVKVLYFQGKVSSQAFIDRLIGDVANTPGALPLLSFTLSELYRRYLARRGDDRSLHEEDYDALGGVGGSLRNRADEVYANLPDEAHRETMKRLMLRMVSVEGGEPARRRVPDEELVYAGPEENRHVQEIVRRLTESRLVVAAKEFDGQPYVEPSHDEFIRGWDKLLQWTRAEQEQFMLRRLLTPAANDWQARQQRWRGLWHDSPHLPLLQLKRRSHDNWLNASEDEFVRRSVTLRRMRRGILAVSLASVFTGLVIGMLVLRGQLVQTRRELVNSDIRRGAVEMRNQHFPTAALYMFRAYQAAQNTQVALGGFVVSDPIADLGKSARTFLSYWQQAMPPCVVCDEAIRIVCYRSDGEIVAVASGNVVRLFDPRTRLVIVTISCSSPVKSIAFGPDRESLAVLMDSGAVELWDSLRGNRLSGPHLPTDIVTIDWNSDGTIAAASKTGRVHLWNPTWKIQKNLEHGGKATAAAWSHDGRSLLTASNDRIRLWDVAAGTHVELFREGAHFEVKSVAFTADDATALALISSFVADGRMIEEDASWVRRWKVSSGEELEETRVGDSSISSATFSADGKYLVVAQDHVEVLDLTDSQPAQKLPADGVTVAILSPDGGMLATGNSAGICRFWPLRTSNHDKQIHQAVLSRGIGPVALSADGRFLATSTPTIGVYPIPRTPTATDFARWDLSGNFDWAQLIAVSETGQKLAAVISQRIRLWSQPWKDDDYLGADARDTTAIAVSDSHNLLVTGHSDGAVRFWSTGTMAQLGEQGLHKAKVNAVAIGSGGQVATADEDGNAYLWNGSTRKRIAGPLVHPQPLFAIGLDRTEKLLVTGSGFRESGQARLWNLHTGMLIGEPLLHDAKVKAVAISRDGTTLATGVEIFSPGAASLFNGEARLWDVATGELREIAYPRNVAAVQSLAFDESGQTLTIGRGGGPVGIAVVPVPQPVANDLTSIRADVESRTGWTVEPDGRFRQLSFAEWYNTVQTTPVNAMASRRE